MHPVLISPQKIMGPSCGWNEMKAQTQLSGHNTTTLAAGGRLLLLMALLLARASLLFLFNLFTTTL
jgi:hypothetical protein